MMFFGRYLTPDGAPDLRPRIDSSLRPPLQKDLTDALSLEQDLYSGDFLGSFENISSDESCGVQLRWNVGAGDSGSTHSGTAHNP
jgi:hypothetical protein